MGSAPISPDQLVEASINSIPDIVVDCVNQLLVEKWCKTSGKATIHQDDIIDLIIEKSNGEITREQIFARKMLDFEPLYKRAGYKVVYDRPAYNESYKANFTFSIGKK